MELIIIKNLYGALEAVTKKEYEDIPVNNKIGSIEVIERAGLVGAGTWEDHMRVLKARAVREWEAGIKSIEE